MQGYFSQRFVGRLPASRRNSYEHLESQRGIVLLVVLIILVVMTIGALTMIRATDSATLVAANLGYRQTGISSSDLAIDAAVAWLGTQSSGDLEANSTGNGYLAFYDQEGPDIKNGQTWAEYWGDTGKLPTGYKCWIAWSGSPSVASCKSSGSGQTADAAGNRSAYLIQRLCRTTGDPSLTSTGCLRSVSSSGSSGNTKGAGAITINSSYEVYYRITARVDGPRDSVTYTQAVVAM